jgi:hypothetical protein
MQKAARWVAITGVFLLAWGAFVVNIGVESLWYDEWGTWNISKQGIFGLVRATAGDVHPPLYYLWLWTWMAWTGSESVLIMRLSSAIPAVLTVALVYRVARDWFRSDWTGLGAALFLACSGFFIYYARELRMYTLVALLVIVSWWMLYRFISGKRGAMFGYATSLALLLYTYYFAAFIFAAQFAIIVLFYRRAFGRGLMALGIAVLAFVPWLPILYSQVVVGRVRSGDPNVPLIGLFSTTESTSPANIVRFFNTYSAGQPAFVLLLVALAMLLALGASHRIWHWLTAALLWFFLTMAAFFAANLVIPVYLPRYPFFVLPGLALLVGVAVCTLPSWRSRLGMTGLIAVVGLATHTAAFPPPKPPHEAMLQTIAEGYQPGDRIWYNFTYGGLGSSLSQEVSYYLQMEFPQLQPEMFIWDAPNDYADVSMVPRVWDARPYWIPVPDAAAAGLTAGRALTEEHSFDAYTVRLYEAPPSHESVIFIGDDVRFALLVTPLHETVFRPGDSVHLKTWWGAEVQPPLDYSYTLLLGHVGDGTPLAQVDNGLVADNRPTSQWTPDIPYLFAPLELTVPTNLAPGEYALWLGVYYWEHPVKLDVQAGDAGLPVQAGLSLLNVARITVQ